MTLGSQSVRRLAVSCRFAGLCVALALASPFGPGLLRAQETGQPARSPSDARENRQRRAPAATVYWPKGVGCNREIPTPKEFFGFEVGHRHLRHDQVAAYMRELARVSGRITIQQYATTHGGRPLLLLTVTSPDNHARLGEIRRRHRQLSKPQADSATPDLAGLPVVMNMGYGVHGDEPSATNTSPLVAHYLAAATGPEIETILQNSVILLDPSLNPDGFDRFARWVNTFRGKVPNPDSAHIEHRQGWPAGRVNYYWFDLNRDWLPTQHPESQGRMKWYHAWKPNVVLDFHEMGTHSTFFFQPGIPERKNPLTPRANVELTREMAGYHAKDLDRIGSLYFTQEVFDDFYMGKGSTYPDLHGSVGILFEQGSSRGHIQESDNGVIRFSDTIRNQFTASLSSLKGASEMREKLLRYQNEFYRESLHKAAAGKIRTYAFALPHNRTRLQAFADILLRHDIQCFWLTADQVVDDRVVKAGSLIVPADQPEYRFLRSLLERRKTFRESVFYDVSAWTLPLAFNLKQTGFTSPITGDLKKCKPAARFPTSLADDTAETETVTYLMDWRDDAAPRVLQQFLQKEIHVRVALRPLAAETVAGGESFGVGTISIPLGVKQNRARRRQIQQIVSRAMKQGVRFDRVTSGLATSGIDLGSNNFPRVKPPAVAMPVGSGISAYQAGAVWHQLDHRLGMPVSLIAVNRLGRADLSRYTTLVLASGSYDNAAATKIRQFAGSGGTVVAIGSAASFVEQQVLEVGSAGGASAAPVADDDGEMPKFSEARKQAALRLVSGAIFGTQIDITHPLMFGFESNRLPVFRGSTRLLQPANPQVSNPAIYLDEPLLAGYASGENVTRIAGTPAVTVHSLGQGKVVLMIDDPNFRAFWPATSRVFLNAVFFGGFTGAR